MKPHEYEIWYHTRGMDWDAEVDTCTKALLKAYSLEDARKQFLDENPGATIHSIDVAEA